MVNVECATALLTQASTVAVPYAASRCENGRFAIALSTGSETGFDNSFRVAHVMAETFVTEVCISFQAPRQALESAFVTVQQELARQFPDQDDIGSASATVIGILIYERQAVIGWIGSEAAYHLSHGELITETKPHTVGAEYPHMRGTLAYLPSRQLLVDNPSARPDILEIQLTGDDQLVLVTQETLKYLNRDEILHLIEEGTFLQQVQASGWGAAAVIVNIQ